MVNGYTEQFSLGVQRELPEGMFAEVSYVGNLGRHLLRQPNINQIPFDLNAANAALPTAQQLPNATLVPVQRLLQHHPVPQRLDLELQRPAGVR